MAWFSRRSQWSSSLRGPGATKVGVQREATVDEQGLTSDVCRLVRQQERGRRAHLLGFARTAHRDVAFTISRFSGSSTHERLIGVTVAPGPIQLTRMSRAAYSSASVWVRFCIPPLLTE